MKIDISYVMTTDARGKDPDSYSPTLRSYHRFLWSKELPNGRLFDLDEKLHHKSDLGEFWLSSDCIGRTFCMLEEFQPIVKQFPQKEIDDLLDLAQTIAAYIVFPANKINNKMTINGARGCNRTRIADRMDLTLECIRRLYIGEKSPLYDCLLRYKDFFDLFGDFKGYADFFLLQDMVTEDYSDILYWKPFSNFDTDAMPKSVEEFIPYRANLVEFINKRNERIDKWQKNL